MPVLAMECTDSVEEQQASCLIVRHTFLDVVDLPLKGYGRARANSDPGLYERFELADTEEPEESGWVDEQTESTGISDVETLSLDGELSFDGEQTPDGARTPEVHLSSFSLKQVEERLWESAKGAAPGPETSQRPWVLFMGFAALPVTTGLQQAPEACPHYSPLSTCTGAPVQPCPQHVDLEQTEAVAKGFDDSCTLVWREEEEIQTRPSEVAGPEFGEASRSTVMLRNLPNNYTRDMLISMLDEEGLAGLYDFVYLPVDLTSKACLGYAFVNLVDKAAISLFWQAFDGYSSWSVPSRKVGHVSWCAPHQGLHAHIELYRNSTIMHNSVPDEFRPVVFRDGLRVDFPAPTKVPKAPRLLNRRPKAGKGKTRSSRH